MGGVGGEFVEFPRISPACFSTWYMASTLYSEVAVSSTCAWVFCRRKRGIPPLFLGATLGHMAGCTRLMQSV